MGKILECFNGPIFGRLLLIFCYIGTIFVISYFSVKYNDDIKINNLYENFNIIIKKYDILKSSNQYNGFIDIDQRNCSVYIYSNNLQSKVITYLNYWYPVNSSLSIYILQVSDDNQIGNQLEEIGEEYGDCILSLPMNSSNDLGMVVGFCIEFLLLLCVTSFSEDPFFIRLLIKKIKEIDFKEKFKCCKSENITDKEVIEMVSFPSLDSKI